MQKIRIFYLKTLLQLHMGKQPIIQLSPPRTGSTKLWNVLRMAYPDRQVIKSHGHVPYDVGGVKLVMSIRNPLDAITSSIKRYEESDFDIHKHIDEFKSNGLSQLNNYISNDIGLVMRYEDFIFDWEYLFEKLEEYIGPIDSELKEHIIEETSIERTKNVAKEFDTFNSYDSVTHIHGKHISDTDGAVGSFKDFLKTEEIYEIYTAFEDIFEKFNYGTNKIQKPIQ